MQGILYCLLSVCFILSSKFEALSAFEFFCPSFINRTEWDENIRNYTESDYGPHIPRAFVFIDFTQTPECKTDEECTENVRNIQRNQADFGGINYNFLVGGNGKIYEGAGWKKEFYMRGYGKTFKIAFISNFKSQLLNEKQVQAAKSFLECGVKLRKIYKEYMLIATEHLRMRGSPGFILYNEIKKWSHYVEILGK